MQRELPTTTITANNNRFLPIVLLGKASFAEHLLPTSRKSAPYERIIEGCEGIRVEVMTNEKGIPIIAITRINHEGEVLCTDGTPDGITCYHHNQFYVCEQHQFSFFNFNIEVEVNWSGHKVSLSHAGLGGAESELIESKKTLWSK